MWSEWKRTEREVDVIDEGASCERDLRLVERESSKD